MSEPAAWVVGSLRSDASLVNASASVPKSTLVSCLFSYNQGTLYCFLLNFLILSVRILYDIVESDVAFVFSDLGTKSLVIGYCCVQYWLWNVVMFSFCLTSCGYLIYGLVEDSSVFQMTKQSRFSFDFRW